MFLFLLRISYFITIILFVYQRVYSSNLVEIYTMILVGTTLSSLTQGPICSEIYPCSTQEMFNWENHKAGNHIALVFLLFWKKDSWELQFSLSNHSAWFPNLFSPLHYMTMLEHDFWSKTIGELTHNTNHFRSEVMPCCAIMKMTQYSFTMESI